MVSQSMRRRFAASNSIGYSGELTLSEYNIELQPYSSYTFVDIYWNGVRSDLSDGISFEYSGNVVTNVVYKGGNYSRAGIYYSANYNTDSTREDIVIVKYKRQTAIISITQIADYVYEGQWYATTAPSATWSTKGGTTSGSVTYSGIGRDNFTYTNTGSAYIFNNWNTSSNGILHGYLDTDHLEFIINYGNCQLKYRYASGQELDSGIYKTITVNSTDIVTDDTTNHSNMFNLWQGILYTSSSDTSLSSLYVTSCSNIRIKNEKLKDSDGYLLPMSGTTYFIGDKFAELNTSGTGDVTASVPVRIVLAGVASSRTIFSVYLTYNSDNKTITWSLQ